MLGGLFLNLAVDRTQTKSDVGLTIFGIGKVKDVVFDVPQPKNTDGAGAVEGGGSDVGNSTEIIEVNGTDPIGKNYTSTQ